MAHPILHSKSNQKKYGGKWEDYIHLHEWIHHSEGIFEAEKIFGSHFTNSDGKIVYTRYCLEDHVKEDCYNYVPSAKEWIKAIESKEKPMWMMRVLELKFDD